MKKHHHILNIVTAVCTIDDNDLNLYIIDSLLNKNLINIIIFFDECNYCDIYYPSINSMVIIDKKINFNIDFDFYHIEENTIYSRKMKLNNILNK